MRSEGKGREIVLGLMQNLGVGEDLLGLPPQYPQAESCRETFTFPASIFSRKTARSNVYH
jgi:hypothetical protein